MYKDGCDYMFDLSGPYTDDSISKWLVHTAVVDRTVKRWRRLIDALMSHIKLCHIRVRELSVSTRE